MRKLMLAILLFHTANLFGQTAIHLTYDEHFYRLLNEKDTAHIRFSEMSDFGRVMRNNYHLRDSLPDGTYKVYVNDSLQQLCYLKGHKKDSIWTSYLPNGQYEIYPYKNGQLNGYYKRFYANGALETVMKYVSNRPFIRTHFYETGLIRMREYFGYSSSVSGFHHIRVEEFNADGVIERIDDSGSPYVKVERKGNCEIDNKLNGKYEIWCNKGSPDEGHFNIIFYDNEILEWQFYDKSNNLVIQEK